MIRKGRHVGMTTTKLELPRGMTRTEAARAAVKKVGGDFRGMKYDPRTGKASVA